MEILPRNSMYKQVKKIRVSLTYFRKRQRGIEMWKRFQGVWKYDIGLKWVKVRRRQNFWRFNRRIQNPVQHLGWSFLKIFCRFWTFWIVKVFKVRERGLPMSNNCKQRLEGALWDRSSWMTFMLLFCWDFMRCEIH